MHLVRNQILRKGGTSIYLSHVIYMFRDLDLLGEYRMYAQASGKPALVARHYLRADCVRDLNGIREILACTTIYGP